MSNFFVFVKHVQQTCFFQSTCSFSEIYEACVAHILSICQCYKLKNFMTLKIYCNQPVSSVATLIAISAEGLRFDSRAVQIGCSVANNSPLPHNPSELCSPGAKPWRWTPPLSGGASFKLRGAKLK